MKKALKISVKRIAAIALTLAVTTTILVTLLLPKGVSITSSGLLSFKVGTSQVQAAGSHDLTFYSGFEFGDFTEWDSITNSPSVEQIVSVASQDITYAYQILYDDNWATQTFTTPAGGWTLTNAEIYSQPDGTPVETWLVSLKAVDGSSHPTGADLASGTLTFRDGAGASVDVWHKVTFDTPYALTGSTEYALVLRTTSTGDSAGNGHRVWSTDGDYFSGGTNATSDDAGSSWTTSPDWDTTFRLGIDEANTGDYMMRANPSSSVEYVSSTTGANPVRSFSSYVYIADYPSVDTRILGADAVYSGVYTNSLWLTTAGEIDLYDKLSGKLADGTTVLDLNTWYRISAGAAVVTLPKYASVWINGSLEHDEIECEDLQWASATDSTMYFQAGAMTSGSTDIYFDNISVSDIATLTDVGDIRVLRAMPDGNGSTQEYDQATAYTLVNSFPKSDATYIEDNGSGAATNLFTLEGLADLGIAPDETMGDYAIARSTNHVSGNTIITRGIAAGSTDVITTVEIYANSAMTGVKVGSFYGSGASWTNRDSETLGTMSSGWEVFTGLSIDVQSGDCLGIYWSGGGTLKRDTSGFTEILTKSGDQFGTGAQTYTQYAGDAISVYAYSDAVTVAAVDVWGTIDHDGGGGTDHMIAVEQGGTSYNSADYDIDLYAWGNFYHADEPNGGADWSISGFEELEVGMYHNGGQDQRSSSVITMVAYEALDGVAVADISNSPSSKAFGTLATSTTYWSNGSEPTWALVDGDAYFTLTNNGDTCSITIESTDFTGGVGWNLVSGSPSTNEVRLSVFEEGDGSGDGLIITNSPQAFIAALATGNVDWEAKLETGSSFTDGALKTATITLIATLD